MKHQTHDTTMNLHIVSKYTPPRSGRRHPGDKPQRAREYLEVMKPNQSVDCTPEEANRFKPAAKRLGVRITQIKVSAKTIRVWKLPRALDANRVLQ